MIGELLTNPDLMAAFSRLNMYVWFFRQIEWKI